MLGINVVPIAGGAVLFLMSVFGDNLQLPPEEPSPKVDVSPAETEAAPSSTLEEATTETEENQTAIPPE
ncbi:MAG: hypothetical protein O7B30_02365 [Thaumarchaeota archaeon]|nr:hypothetical protein [Nitrososphaerota archaeon]